MEQDEKGDNEHLQVNCKYIINMFEDGKNCNYDIKVINNEEAIIIVTDNKKENDDYCLTDISNVYNILPKEFLELKNIFTYIEN